MIVVVIIIKRDNTITHLQIEHRHNILNYSEPNEKWKKKIVYKEYQKKKAMQ